MVIRNKQQVLDEAMKTLMMRSTDAATIEARAIKAIALVNVANAMEGNAPSSVSDGQP